MSLTSLFLNKLCYSLEYYKIDNKYEQILWIFYLYVVI
jgi:hypothetical protein